MADDLITHTTEIVANTAGGTVAPAVTAALTTAALVTKNPELAMLSVPLGAAGGAVVEQGFKAVAAILRDRTQRVGLLIRTVEDETGAPIDDLLDGGTGLGGERELFGHVVDAATTARTAWKIKMLARAFVQGARDGDRIDETLMFIKLVRDMEAGHARYLAALCLHASSVAQAVPGEEPTVAVGPEQLREQDPGLGLATPILREELQAWKFIKAADGNKEFDHLTRLGLACAQWLRGLNASGG
ncbi:hypothetical protein [Dactylosporangium sp. NPDC049140]|uniref:hypothetical protein n=1 Tax=Dactylosporangium sp. NPDC049140 TaxID=3155647 RepID=UPI0033CC55EB